MKISKAIIPAAGLGTRFLPATKAQPKEMLPIVDKPTIQYIVEEAVQSGIEDIMIISGRGKRAIEDHFDKSYELEETLAKKGKTDLLAEIRSISNLANIHYVRQKEPKGLGHAIYCAKSFIGNEPFAVLLGDDIVEAEVPCLKQIIEIYQNYKGTVIGVQPVKDEDVSKYGIIEPEYVVEEKVFKVKSLVEKPAIGTAPSKFAVMGRYILEPEIFDILKSLPPGTGDEIQLTDAIRQLALFKPVFAHVFKGQRYDAGDKLGFIKATIEIGLKREDLKDQLTQYLNELINEKKRK
ncbi:UTP--glucose-1-phosphate uridylyltransferase GalU [Bacillus methanolicus]|uniref:UTP--glucose-1-phosphate uridylyltransferase n=1 Tax=Bacillus methanolicus (strain MGA3 / ATCC 53907) TaxID=796606 RepID=I3EBS6_BACMM|nr:UTP--glucose-1-phosphate uridylyltransferase GalU [Bacillus methanolicus]AIE61628.1 UTP-glucose-1-phosphate uridylyltransferase [Bacillus methanolicus MGA3]EIJ83947.1 UTP-glucose-1-phosphate uridylyltransferase [Bacillus methanolicus MGA3]